MAAHFLLALACLGASAQQMVECIPCGAYYKPTRYDCTPVIPHILTPVCPPWCSCYPWPCKSAACCPQYLSCLPPLGRLEAASKLSNTCCGQPAYFPSRCCVPQPWNWCAKQLLCPCSSWLGCTSLHCRPCISYPKFPVPLASCPKLAYGSRRPSGSKCCYPPFDPCCLPWWMCSECCCHCYPIDYPPCDSTYPVDCTCGISCFCNNPINTKC